MRSGGAHASACGAGFGFRKDDRSDQTICRLAAAIDPQHYSLWLRTKAVARPLFDLPVNRNGLLNLTKFALAAPAPRIHNVAFPAAKAPELRVIEWRPEFYPRRP
jgi:hypothetical protein